MKKISVILFFLLLSISTLTVFSQEKDKVEIFGYYTIVKPTKDFADISVIHLSGEYGANENPPIYGLIRLERKSAKDFSLLKPTLTGKRLIFTTQDVNGIYYKFKGDFTKLGDFPTLQPNGEVILKGTLTKYRGKKIIASATVKLSYEAGD